MADTEVAGTDWSNSELDLIVANYFAMLKEEQAGQIVHKTEHRRLLKTHVQRSDGSIEFKHRNISAVLTRLGLPRIRGYIPAWNFQGAIAEATGRYLEIESDPVPMTPSQPLVGFADVPSLFESAPPAAPPISPKARTAFERVARKFDPALRDQLNRLLGLAGEQLIYEREKQLLIDQDRVDLARKVRWVSQEDVTVPATTSSPTMPLERNAGLK